MAIAPQTNDRQKSTGETSFVTKGYLTAFILVTSLFFMWAIANNFNDILIKQFQKALDLTRTQSGLIQTAFYFGYFTMALPAGWVMSRFGYKNGILIGLALYACGALFFYPAAEIRAFGAFLAALYVIAAGLAFLETAANPYITVMGPADTAAQRLNLAQSFNGFGGFLAPFIGGALIFSGVEYTAVELADLPPDALEAYRVEEARAVQIPYLGLAAIAGLLALATYLIKFPKVAVENDGGQGPQAIFDLLKVGRVSNAVVTQFFYVGAQVGIWSYFINFAQDIAGVGEVSAANYLGLSLFTFMTGRFLGTALMRYIQPARLLVVYACINVSLCAMAIAASGWTAVVALGATSFFMSIMFPTIFALGVQGLGERTKYGSSLIIMAIVGGALFPPFMGAVADAFDNIQASIAVPLICFVTVALFGKRSLGNF